MTPSWNFEDHPSAIFHRAISYLLYTSFGMSSNNSVQRTKFINAKPVYFPPMEAKWSNDDYGNGSYQTSVFNDKDGSVSGVPNSFTLINDVQITQFSPDDAREIKPTWTTPVQGRRQTWTIEGAKLASGGREAGAGRGGGRGRASRSRRSHRPRRGCGSPALPALAGVAPVVSLALYKRRPGRPLRLRVRQSFSAATVTRLARHRRNQRTERVPRSWYSLKGRPRVLNGNVELDSGFRGWIFEPPGFTTAASGTEQSSLDALRKASAISYYKGNALLFIKLVSSGDVIGTGLGSGPGGGASSPGQPVNTHPEVIIIFPELAEYRGLFVSYRNAAQSGPGTMRIEGRLFPPAGCPFQVWCRNSSD